MGTYIPDKIDPEDMIARQVKHAHTVIYFIGISGDPHRTRLKVGAH